MNVLENAREYTAAGLSVIPVKADGSKSPLMTGWRKYTNEIADDKTLVEWFGGGGLMGIGITAGPASGNLVILDFEHHDESAYVEWRQRLPEDLAAYVATLPTVSTPSGGRHVYIRLAEPQPGGKLARYMVGKTKIEIRGEGHQVLAPGCPAECHNSGQLYNWAITGPIQVVEEKTWLEMLSYCGQCNEYTAPEQPRDRDYVRGSPAGKDSPGNDFNRRGSWGETGLFEVGWSWAKQVDDDRGYITRPGKETGISASVGMVSSKEHGYPYLFSWTTSTDFPAETPFSRFAVFATLKHKGDFSEAAKDLARQGYGERPGMGERPAEPEGLDLSEFQMKLHTPNGKPFNPFAKPGVIQDDAGERSFKWASELMAQDDDTKWLWKGYLPRGGITLFSALWKSGKSTLLSHLIKALDGSVTEFLGQEVAPSRVLYVAEEDEKIWAGRRDTLLLGDHIGFVIRPFKMRPTVHEWRGHLAQLKEEVIRHRFDLVVFDTLSKMWPVKDENNAGEVEESLLPLWDLSGVGATILLVHHTRKGGGEQFVGARGSGGLPAFCEVLMEFTRDTSDIKETKRQITAVGRYSDIPPKLLCELANGQYVGLGDPDDRQKPEKEPKVKKEKEPKAAKVELWKNDLTAVLVEFDGAWKSAEVIHAAMTILREGQPVIAMRTMMLALNALVDSKEVERQDQPDEERKPGQVGRPPQQYRLAG